eukprot:2628008-Amphidinium_carterae.1
MHQPDWAAQSVDATGAVLRSVCVQQPCSQHVLYNGWRGLCASPTTSGHIDSTTTSTSSQHKQLQPTPSLPSLSDRYPSSPSLQKVAHLYLE